MARTYFGGAAGSSSASAGSFIPGGTGSYVGGTPSMVGTGALAPIPPSRLSMTDESELLSRIRDRAESHGLRVKLKQQGGMFHTLTKVFGETAGTGEGMDGEEEVEEADDSEAE
jgi:hypothetical protein